MVIQLQYRAEAEVTPAELPLSKSIALRVLTLNSVAEALGLSPAGIPALPDAEDVEGMQRAREAYAAQLALLSGGAEVADPHMVHIGEGGAPLRFFTALAASTPGIDLSISTGRSLMRRPLMLLLEALREAGAEIHCERKEGYPPLRILGRRLAPESLGLNPGVSSQFVSALMMASPLWQHGLHLHFDGAAPVSAPYIAMTAEIMRRFGAEVEWDEREVRVAPGKLQPPAEYCVETDWSAASYFYELAILLPGHDIPLARLTPPDGSLQGDARCAEIFSLLGVTTTLKPDGSAVLRCDPRLLDLFRDSLHPLELDMNATPDLVPALAVGFCLAGIRFRFSGVGHLKHKETDRMLALSTELSKLGYMLDTTPDTMAWLGARCPAGDNESIATYSDHRMAMAFAPAAAKLPYIAIEDPGVVGKSFPGYWRALEGLGFEIRTFKPRGPEWLKGNK